MVEQYNDNLVSIFHALADPTRREIVRLIASKECTVSEGAVPFGYVILFVQISY